MMKAHTELEAQFFADCKIIDLKYEYNGYTGTERYGLITSLSEMEIQSKYRDLLAAYTPYIILDIAVGEIRSTYIRNEKKHEMRRLRAESIWGFDDSTEYHNKELITDGLVVDEIIRAEENAELMDAICSLPEIQRRRIIKYYYDGKTMAQIAEEEQTNKANIKHTIDRALKRLKKIYWHNFLPFSVGTGEDVCH